MTERNPFIRVTAMPTDTNPYGGVFGGWLMGQMGLACGSFVSQRIKGKALLVAADALSFRARWQSAMSSASMSNFWRRVAPRFA